MLATTAVSLAAASAVPPPARASSAAGNLGTAAAGERSAALAANRKWVSAYRLPVAAQLEAVSVYLAPGKRSARELVQGVVYADREGVPDQLLGVSRQLAFRGSERAGRYTLEFGAALALAPGTYWIGLIAGGRAGAARYRYSESAHARCFNTNRYASGPSHAFGRCTSDSRRMSVYATYAPMPAPQAEMPPPTLLPASPQAEKAGPPAPSPTLPVELSAPAISGLPQEGQQLTASTGTWSNAPTSFTYEWLRCNAFGEACTAIALATSPSYLVVAADTGHKLRVSVAAWNAAGSSTPAFSQATAAVTAPPSPPANVSPPAVSGVAQEGQELTASPGTWSNEPTSFTYAWLRCDALGEECVAIAGASKSTYTLTGADVNATVRASVVASNAAGSSAPALSLASEVVSPPPSAPVNVSSPAISGVAQQGQQLTASTGTWSNEPTSFTYAWQRCDAQGASCVKIASASSSTYTLVEADVGHTLRVAVVAANAVGPSKATRSEASEVVAAAAAVNHYEYVFNDGPVSVYDIDQSFKLVESFSLPGTTKGVRGVAVSPSTHMMYVSYGGNGAGGSTGSVLAYDLVTKEVKWSVNLTTGVDSLAVSNDSKLLYMPDGAGSSNGNWYILSTADGSVVGKIETAGTAPHDGVLSADGKLLQLGDRDYNKLPIYNTQTEKIEKEVGPFVGGVRPNTIDGSDSLSFITANNFDGFQIGSITTGKVLYTESFGACSGPFTTCSHGVSLSPDSKHLYVIDTVHKAVQAWDVQGADEGVAPTHLAEIPVDGLEGNEEGCSGSCEREGWLAHTLDGRYVLAGDTGDVIETATQKVVMKISNLLNTREYVEIDWSGGVPVATSGRQGIGYTG